MKKFLFIICLVMCGCNEPPKRPPVIDRETYIKELLSCTPDKPLSKGELYERAMVDFLQEKTDEAWWGDYQRWEYQQEKPPIEREKFNGDEVAQLCGLIYNWLGRPKAITKDRCYPYHITKYDEYQDFDYRHQARSFESFLVSSEAKVYRPNIDPPIYKAENHDKNVDFVLIHNNSVRESLYPKDCCKLITYNEMKYRDAMLRGFNHIPSHIPKNQLQQLSILEIKEWGYDYDKNGKKIPKDHHSFYVISPCGRIIP